MTIFFLLFLNLKTFFLYFQINFFFALSVGKAFKVLHFSFITRKEDENEFTEPFNFDIVMNALSNGKEIPNEELKEYSIQARKIYNKNGTITIRLNKNRKKSMQQLKKIANEEIISFLSLPVKTIPLHKKSSKNFQHLGNPFDSSA